MRYLDVPTDDRYIVKEKAYNDNPEIWKSYSGKTKREKQFIDKLRAEALDYAASFLYLDEDDCLKVK